MDRIIRYYLYILPIFSLIGIILGSLRIAYATSFSEYMLLLSAIFDLFIVLTGWKKLINNKIITLVLILLLISLIVGLFNNEMSRRFITDFTNPFFFFAKIYIFKIYWQKYDFSLYVTKYYIRAAFWGSLALLPFVYLLFSRAGATRMAIFPPMELPFSYHMQSGGLFFFVSLIIILLYGKRAQLIGAVLTFFMYIILFKKKQIVKYLVIAICGSFALWYIFENYSDNYAVSRLSSTFTQVEDNRQGGVEGVAGSRAVEIESILREMTGAVDYIFGKGFGFEYHFEFNQTNKMHSNAHFTPVALLSKYGTFFTLFIYLYFFYCFFNFKRKNFDLPYFTALGTCLFVFFESFFSYALFVTPIFPVALGYILYRQQKLKTLRYV